MTEGERTTEFERLATGLPNGYIVSTIEVSELGKMFDGVLSLMVALVGDIGRADLAAEGDYETMVFRQSDWDASRAGHRGGLRELEFHRWPTPEAAREGHAEVVKSWREMPPGL